MYSDPNFKPDYPSNNDSSIPTSVKKQLWEKVYIKHFKFEGKYYYVDIRYPSPFGYEYDIWSYYGEDKIQHRIDDGELVYKICVFLNRKKKIKGILGKIE
jgi:hypothetical protein